MSVASISTKKKKKVVIPRRPKTGLGAVPFDNKRGWEAIKYYFHYELDKKDIAACIKDYVKKNYSKEDAKIIGYNPEWKFTMHTHHAATAYCLEKEYAFEGKAEVYPPALKKYCDDLLESGRELEAEKLQEAALANQTNVVVLSPQQRLVAKVNNTIGVDLDELEDAWIAGEKPTLEIYNLMQKHELKGAAVSLIKPRLEGWLLDYRDAYEKNCEQAVEGYSHITRREQKRRITDIERMLADLESFGSAQKAKRAPRKPKPKSADKQVAKVKYQKENSDFKLASIDPTQIIGAYRLYVFNTKYKQLTEYVTTAVKGFEVSGTTIKNFDPAQSRKMTLRKPQDMLPIVLKKTANQIAKAIDGLTTKPSVPNGRLNEDTILLRVF
jgi:hypothetical protein